MRVGERSSLIDIQGMSCVFLVKGEVLADGLTMSDDCMREGYVIMSRCCFLEDCRSCITRDILFDLERMMLFSYGLQDILVLSRASQCVLTNSICISLSHRRGSVVFAHPQGPIEKKRDTEIVYQGLRKKNTKRMCHLH